MTLQIIRDWVVEFNAGGPSGLIDRKPLGQPPRLVNIHHTALIKMIEQGPDPQVHGVVRWRLIATVRERFSCRDCQTVTQPPAPFHVTARGWAGPSLLAMIAFEKFGQHQPLNRKRRLFPTLSLAV